MAPALVPKKTVPLDGVTNGSYITIVNGSNSLWRNLRKRKVHKWWAHSTTNLLHLSVGLQSPQSLEACVLSVRDVNPHPVVLLWKQCARVDQAPSREATNALWNRILL